MHTWYALRNMHGKDSVIEAACGGVVNEAARLGIFKLIS